MNTCEVSGYFCLHYYTLCALQNLKSALQKIEMCICHLRFYIDQASCENSDSVDRKDLGLFQAREVHRGDHKKI
ncbi:hypothetical protein QTP88_009301 [Uroleucon formosanum]